MWTLRFAAALDAWAAVPAADEHERRRQWRAAVAHAVSKRWEVEAGPRFSESLLQVLDMLQSSRPQGALADLVTWQTPSPVPVRVSVHPVVQDEATDWAALGFAASPYLGGPFGEGVQYTRRIPEEEAYGVASIDAAVVFDRGDAAVVVRVHACPVDVYVAAAPAIAELIDSCVLTDPTGRPFTTGKSEYRRVDDPDVWPEEGMSARV